MRCYKIMLASCGIILLLSTSMLCIGQQDLLELHNSDGWTIPGLQAISKEAINPTIANERVAGCNVTVSKYDLTKANLKNCLGRLPIIIPLPESMNAFAYKEFNFAAYRITIYEYEGWKYGIIIIASIYKEDPSTKTGGFVTENKLVFEDRNKDGKYEVMIQGYNANYIPEPSLVNKELNSKPQK
jgi:hypothetical protein